MFEPKYLTPPSSSALKFSERAPIVVSARTPMTMPEMVSTLRSFRRQMLRRISMSGWRILLPRVRRLTAGNVPKGLLRIAARLPV